MKNKKLRLAQIAFLAIPLIFLLLVYFFPMGKLLRAVAIRSPAGLFREFRWDIVGRTFWFTAYQALLSTAFTLLVGMPAAFLFAKFRFPGKSILKLISTLPFILPTVVTAAAFNSLFAPRGWINLLLMAAFKLDQPLIQIQNSLTAILLAHVFYNTSIVIRVLGSAWSRLDPKLENAASSLGASPFTALRRVILPQLTPSLLSATLLVFLFDFTSFGVILMLGGPRFSTMEVEIYIQTMQLLNLPLAGMLSLIQLVFTMAVSLLVVHISGEIALPVLIRVNGLEQKRAEKFFAKAFVVGMTLLLLILFGLPVFGLVLRSVTVNDGSNIHYSLTYYKSLFENLRQSVFYVPPAAALKNSIIFAASTSFLTMLLGLMLSYALHSAGKIRRLVELALLLPMGTSAVTLGLGFFVAYRGVSLSEFNYFLLIPAAHSLVALPFAMRIIQPAMDTIPGNLRNAACSLGASPEKVWRYIELPLISPAVITALIYAFTISLGEFGATSFLSRPDIPTMPVAIFRYLNFPGGSNYGRAMAMAVIILAVCSAGIALLDKIQMNQGDMRKENNAAN
jgi:thiamine transport system permease protein